MPPITNPEALRFSNESIRPGADRHGRSYYRADALRDRWNGLTGSTSAKIMLVKADMRLAADQLRDLFKWTFDREQLWFLGYNAIITDTADSIADGRTDVPPITGVQANRIIDRFRQWNNYLRTGNFDSFAAGNYATLNMVLSVCSDGLAAISDADGQNFINVCNALANRYEATSNAELSTILAVAVNPNPTV